MQHNNFSRNQDRKTVADPRSAPATDLTQDPIDFSPAADEVARRAYFSYVGEGSQPGRDVQHWLKAEADLLAERNLTRTHGFHNQT
jgi:hypothetical protein